MNNSAEKVLYRKAALIFEELGFLMPRPESGPGASSEGCSHAAVFFRGPFTGCLVVSLSSETLSQLAANMLGGSDMAIEQMEQDSLREAANVICGNALPAIYGFEPIFHLDAPALCDRNPVEGNATYHKVAQVHVAFEEGYADVALYSDEAATPIQLEQNS